MEQVVSDFLISLLLCISIPSAMSFVKGTFSIGLFLASLVVCISVLCWIPLLPIYAMIVPALIIGAMLMKDRNGGVPSE